MWPFSAKSANGSQYDVATVSDRGLVRPDNQDDSVALPEKGFFGVADGMGGGKGGELASRWICEALALAAEDTSCTAPDLRRRLVDDVLQRTNKRIRLYAREQGYRMMGATAALLYLDGTEPQAAQVMWVGDSRVYRLRGGVLEAFTHDHTVGNELGRMLPPGGMTAREMTSRRNPLTHVLTRAVGTELNVRPDVRNVDIRRGDRWFLCTDGVHDVLDDAELAALLKGRGDAAAVAERVTAAVRAAGAPDNFTFIVVFVS